MNTVDATPTWEAMVPVMLEIATRSRGKTDAWRTIREEFRRMAEAADRWNQHCKESQAQA